MRFTITTVIVLILAGPAPTRAQIVIDHQPHPYGGSASDLDFRDNFGVRQWQQSADDFRVSQTVDVVAINWWAFYREDNPPKDESVRIRLYANRETEDLPGEVLSESIVTNPVRNATGRQIAISGLPREFWFQASLVTPIHVDSEQTYWLEITQIDDINSYYLVEYALAEQTGRAFVNGVVEDWQRTSVPTDLAFQLIIPEPATVSLLLLGLGLAAGLRARGHP